MSADADDQRPLGCAAHAGVAGGTLPAGRPTASSPARRCSRRGPARAGAFSDRPAARLHRRSSPCVAIYAWSRAVEGPRRAKDRLVTMAIVAAFGLALIPLISLLYEVTKRGIPGLSVEFFTESTRAA